MAEPIFVAREQELKELQLFFDQAIEGRGRTVLVSGEAGSGKTRFINEFLNVAREKTEILTGSCLGSVTLPYFPFLEAFDSYITYSGDGGKSIKSQLLEIKALLMGTKNAEIRLEQPTPEAWKDMTYAAVTKELLLMSTNKPIVLVLEDIHLADSASISLLHYISRGISSERILILASFRSEELNVDAEGHQHPLVDAMQLMRREDLFTEIRLSNLNQSDIAKIAENMLGGSIHPELVEKLVKESECNPLFIVESLRMLYEQRSLIKEDDQWRLSVDTLGIPTKIKYIILRRLALLKPNQRRMIDIASAIGDKFNTELLGTVVGQDALEILETLTTIMKSTSLVRVEESFYRFDHSKTREVLYDEIPLPLKRGYHARIAERIESAGQDIKKLPVSELAYHYERAGNEEKAIKYALAAGEDALLRFSNTEATRYFTYVVNSKLETPERNRQMIMALEGLGDAFFARGLFQEATKTFERLSSISEPNEVRLRALRKAVTTSRWGGDFLHSLQLASKAEEYAAFNSLEFARVRVQRGMIMGLGGKANEGLIELEEALKVFEEKYSPLDAAFTMIQAALLYVNKFETEKALRMACQSLALYEELEDFHGQAETCMLAGNVFFSCRLYQKALESYDKAIEIGGKIGDYHMMAWAYIYSGLLLDFIGESKEAISRSLKGIEYSEKTDAYYILGFLYATITNYYAKRGDLMHADEFYRKLMKLSPLLDRIGTKAALWAVTVAKASYLTAKNQFEEANNQFEKSLEFVKATILSSLYEACTRMNYAWSLEKQGRTADAKMQIEEAQKMYEKLEKRPIHANIQACLVAKRETEAGEEIDIRLDLVNVALNSGTLVKVAQLVPQSFDVTKQPSQCILQNGSLDLKKIKLAPLQVESIKIKLQPTEAGVYQIYPQVYYADDIGELKIFSPKSFNITVLPRTPPLFIPEREIKEERFEHAEKEAFITVPKLIHDLTAFEFKTEAAEKAFEFLINAFIEDYMRQRLSIEKSGWRTLMKIVKHGKITKYSAYGFEGHPGKAISELERRGLIEARVFPGEKGRGGRIQKFRIMYEKETVKRYVDFKVMKI